MASKACPGPRSGVEAVQAFDRREAGVPDAALHRARLAVKELQLDQPQQIAQVIDALGGALPGELLVLPQQPSAASTS